MSFATPTFPTQPVNGPRPRFAMQRGTRGFLAFLLAIIGAMAIGLGSLVLPSTGLGGVALSWLVALTIAFGIGHLAAAVGVIRDSAWAPSLALYLAAIGMGVVAYGLLASLTGADPFAPTSTLPADRARADGIGYLVWMLGMWAVVARFALRAKR